MYMSEFREPEGNIAGHVKGTNIFKSGFSKSELKGTHKNSTRIIGKKIQIQKDFTWFELFGILYIRSQLIWIYTIFQKGYKILKSLHAQSVLLV